MMVGERVRPWNLTMQIRGDVPGKSCIFGAGIHTMTMTPVEKKWWATSGNDLYWLMPPHPEVARFHKR